MKCSNAADHLRNGWAKASRVKIGALAVAVFAAATASALAQNLESQEIQPAPARSGPMFRRPIGPQPSEVKREYVGANQELKSGKVSTSMRNHHPAPLRRRDEERPDGRRTASTSASTATTRHADQLGLNYSPKLTFADVGRAVRQGPVLRMELEIHLLRRKVVDLAETERDAGATFPISSSFKQFQPSGVGDNDYTPLVKINDAGGIDTAPAVAITSPCR